MRIKGQIVLIALLFLLNGVEASTYIISQEFFTNEFTNNDFNVWTITAPSLPQMLFSTCNSNRLFGGYQIFTGDTTNPTSISRSWPGLIPHYSVRLAFKLYKIDSWPSNTFFIRMDSTTISTFTFNSANAGTSNLCGNPSPILDAINTNYNDKIVNVDITIPHTASTLTVEFISNLVGSTGAWGIRQLNITMEACDQSCASCTNSSACSSCLTTNGLTLSGPFCVCSAGYKQKVIPCTVYPCVSCVASCTLGYYYSATTTYCEPCNIACSNCISGTNSIATCSSCATSNGFVGAPLFGTICSSCYSGCKTCSTTAANACTACLYQYFLYNNSCLAACPSGYFGSEKAATCTQCVSPCATCVGLSATPYFCLSCVAGYYLWNYSCVTPCPNLLFGYLGNCLAVCPQTTFADTTTHNCLNCISNCLECPSVTTCSLCVSNAFLLSGVCYLICPAGYYGDSSSSLCLGCDGNCLSCNGPLPSNCLSCAAGAVLVYGVCYTTCPINTYSASCLPCDSSCLTCSGSLSTNCLSCQSPYFYHLNDSTCLLSCSKGELSNNYNLTCSRCISGQVAYFQKCQSCDPSCSTCSGITFLQCSSCTNQGNLISTACVLSNENGIVFTPDKESRSLQSGIKGVLIVYLVLAILVEIIFQYKTSLLPLLQLLQILSYTFYLSIKMSENTQRAALLIYHSNFSAIIKIFQPTASKNLPAKFQLMGKSGFFFPDAIGPHICLISAVLAHLGIKYLAKRFPTITKFYNKINPYLIAYMFRLVCLELCLDLVLYLYCFEVQSVMGGASLALLLFDFCIIVMATCWRIRTVEEGSQVALLYNNQIGESHADRQAIYEESNDSIQTRIKKNQILPAALSILSKLPVAITILLFVGNKSTQTICFLVYFIIFFLLTLLIPYRRRIYRVVMIVCGTVLVLNSIIAVIVSKGASSYSFDVLWLLVIIFGLCLTFMQVVVNYQYFIHFLSYSCHNIKKMFDSDEKTKKKQKQEESHSNLTEWQIDEQNKNKSKVVKEREQKINQQ